MSLLLAPYHNAMRLGQGFNSYTQQICIDNAVVVDPNRSENGISNDGFAMSDLRPPMAASSATRKNDDETPSNKHFVTPELEQKAETISHESVSAFAPQTEPAEATKDSPFEEEIDALEADGGEPKEIQAKQEMVGEDKPRLAAYSAMAESARARKSVNWCSDGGLSQIVTYSSRFVENLSEITDDMKISGAPSIKYSVIGGSGKGSFIDTDKFIESDLNFYIGVKVINQTVSCKDALIYRGLPSVDRNNFLEVYGDCFISGFLEGGEFNALVSIKVLNMERKTDIVAQAKVVLTTGPPSVETEAEVKLAKDAVSNNTETTIQVSWSGGGHIKAMGEPWTIDTLQEVAAKFPDLVATTPQKTYAILTKYETLRSYLALKPEKLAPVFYEVAAIYTNSMMDAYMDYKNIYKTLTAQIFEVQTGVKAFGTITARSGTYASTDTREKIDDSSMFEPSYAGLENARRACRCQMIKIVNEVDALTKDPKLAADENRPTRFQSPVLFRERLPEIKPIYGSPVDLLKVDGKVAITPPLYDNMEQLDEEERKLINTLTKEKPRLGSSFRLAPLEGSNTGDCFCHLDYLKPDSTLMRVAIETVNGVVTALGLRYTNGLVLSLGCSGSNTNKKVLNIRFEEKESIIACSVETGRATEQDSVERVTALRLYTNRGNKVIGQSSDWAPPVKGTSYRDGIKFESLKMSHFDPLLENGQVKGFWGRCKNTATQTKHTGLYRIGPIWGNVEAIPSSIQNFAEENPAITSLVQGGYVNFPPNNNTEGGWNETYMTKVIDRPSTLSVSSDDGPTSKIVTGIKLLDLKGYNRENFRMKVYSENETAKQFNLSIDCWGGTQYYSVELSWIEIPNSDRDILTGKVESYGRGNRDIKFQRPYALQPNVLVWVAGADVDGNSAIGFSATPSNITKTGFTMNFSALDYANPLWCSAVWMAYSSTNISLDSGTIEWKNGNSAVTQESPLIPARFTAAKFSKAPSKVLLGFNNLHINYTMRKESRFTNYRIDADVNGTTKDGFSARIRAWYDTSAEHASYYWLAIL